MIDPLAIADYIVPIILFIIGQTILFVGVCVTIYTRAMTRLKELEVRLTMVEKHEVEIFEKLDKLLESNHRIEMKLSNKQDRNL